LKSREALFFTAWFYVDILLSVS